MSSLPSPTLSDRKRQLIAESSRLRLEISGELDAIEHSLGWVSQGLKIGSAVRKGGFLLTAASGLFLALKLFKQQPKEQEAFDAAEAEETSGFTRMIQGGLKVAGVVAPLVKILLR